MITREVDLSSSATTKPEGNDTTSEHRNVNLKVSSAIAATPTSSWTRLKDPRIVRVSRAFGGKDRHSKVCTVRGLRDRRVRLSVATAIQLYDLQDRLGLNQPSKVVDWLLNAAKNEIDELPPLQLPPAANFNPNLQQWLCSAAATAAATVRRDEKFSKEIAEDDDHDNDNDNDDGNHQDQESHHEIDDNPNKINLLPRSHNSSSSSSSLMMSNAAQFNSFLRWDPHHHHHHHHQGGVSEDFHNFNVLPLASPSGLPHSFFHHPQTIIGGGEFEPSSRQIINFQMLNHPSPASLRPPIHDFTTHSLRPLRFLAPHNHTGSHPSKDPAE